MEIGCKCSLDAVQVTRRLKHLVTVRDLMENVWAEGPGFLVLSNNSPGGFHLDCGSVPGF